MRYSGSCQCQRWQVDLRLDVPLEQLHPRVCDCSYCQAHPSRILSDPAMSVAFTGEGLSIHQNGDQLAHFYHCKACGQLLAVGCELNGQLRGAVNADLLVEAKQLGETVQIQPRLLSADEKLARWNKLWGALSDLR